MSFRRNNKGKKDEYKF